MWLRHDLSGPFCLLRQLQYRQSTITLTADISPQDQAAVANEYQYRVKREPVDTGICIEAYMNKIVLFLDPIECCSYPVTETGYGLLYRLWQRAKQAEIWLVYPESTIKKESHSNQLSVTAHRLLGFDAEPYRYYAEQKTTYDCNRDLGSCPCHRQTTGTQTISLNDSDIIVWRQEQAVQTQNLEKLILLEDDVLLFHNPRLLLESQYSSKNIPRLINSAYCPVTYHTTDEINQTQKIHSALAFIDQNLSQCETIVVKPIFGDNGHGITLLGYNPVTQEFIAREDYGDLLAKFFSKHGDFVVQEYISTVRLPKTYNSPADTTPNDLGFGEVRFILINGQLPKNPDGTPIVFARRTPTPDSFVADSGISYPTYLTKQETLFLEEVGQYYKEHQIHFGGGDLIRTNDPKRPFVFTDAARAVCGHAIVTGGLNKAPYLIIDQVIDCLWNLWETRQRSKAEVMTA